MWFISCNKIIVSVWLIIRSNYKKYNNHWLLSIFYLTTLYHYGVTMSLYVTCKRECNYLRSCTLAITRCTASLSRHALSYFHFHLSLVTLHLLLDTLLSLSHCIHNAYFDRYLSFFCCCTRSRCLSFGSWYNARVPLTAWYSFCLWVRKLSTLPSVVY